MVWFRLRLYAVCENSARRSVILLYAFSSACTTSSRESAGEPGAVAPGGGGAGEAGGAAGRAVPGVCANAPDAKTRSAPMIRTDTGLGMTSLYTRSSLSLGAGSRRDAVSGRRRDG